MVKFSNEVLPQAQGASEQSAVKQNKQDGPRLNRRNFLFTAGLTAGAAGALGMTAGCGGVFGVDPSSGPAPSVADVLNFALNLEYLEANFYLFLTSGVGLPAQYQGVNPGAATPLAPIAFADPILGAFAKQLAADELAHVRLLRATLISLGITPVDQPALNLAALGTPNSDATFLAIARALETTGVSAYEGGIGFLASSIPAVNYGALIHVAEGQHEGVLRQFCIAKGVSSPAVDGFDHTPSLGGTTIFNTSPLTGLNTARNASEVLRIVYAAPNSTGISSGGFFPQGLNGAVKTT